MLFQKHYCSGGANDHFGKQFGPSYMIQQFHLLHHYYLSNSVGASTSYIGGVIKTRNWPGEVAHACNPNTLEGRDGQITRGQESETSLTNMEKPRLYEKYKIIWAWWHVPVIPATWESEAGQLLESGRQRLQ